MRVIVKTTADITANLEADRIEESEFFFKVFKGDELVGIFEVGCILCMYETQSPPKGKPYN